MRIAIIGLGLIGSSIGLALKRSNWQKAEIVGYARRSEVAQTALEMGVVDITSESLEESVESAELVIIATPVLAVKEILTKVAPHLVSGCIITDTASTKLQVLQWAKELLPKEISFIGGHPMAGKETFGIKAAEAQLFDNCAYCLIPASQVKPTAVQIVTSMVEMIGAIPITISAEEHDRLVAGISHLPLLLSAALVMATTQHPSWEQMSQLASSGYRDITRLASGNPEVNAHICLSNRGAIVSWIDEFIEKLRDLSKLVADGDNEIEEALALASEARRRWLEKRC